MELLDDAARRLMATLHTLTAAERGEAVRRVAQAVGVAERTVYRRLAALGWSSGRAPRADKGSSTLSAAAARDVAQLVASGVNKRGQTNLPVSEAVALAQEAGVIPQVSTSTVRRRLDAEGLSVKAMRAPEPSVARVSQHPNHVHFFDISIAAQWHFHDDAGKRLDLYTAPQARNYKPEQMRAVRQMLHRFTLVDHYSGAFFVRYYWSAGEAAEDVVDFLWRAWSPKRLDSAYPFKGLPRRLVMDPGSANRSALVTSLLDALNVTAEYHAAGNAKASGTVETRHNHWQRTFEGRLALKRAANLDELNAWAEQSLAEQNATKALTRSSQPPILTWATLRPEQLRLCPDRDTFFSLAAARPQERTLDAYLRVSVDGRVWELSGQSLYPGQKVAVKLAPFSDAGLRAWDGQGRELAATALSFNPVGLPENGRRHVWDDAQARGASVPAPPAQTLRREVLAQSMAPVPVDPWAELPSRVASLHVLAPEGQPFQPSAQAPLISSLDAREELVRRLGRPLGEDAAWWRTRLGDGVTRTALEALWAEFTQVTAEGTLDAANL